MGTYRWMGIILLLGEFVVLNGCIWNAVWWSHYWWNYSFFNDQNAHKTIDFRSVYITQFLTGRASGIQFVVWQIMWHKHFYWSIGPFHLMYTPPLRTRSIKFEPLRKKYQSANTNTPPEIKKFLPYPSEKTQRSKDADAHNPSETAFSNPLRNSRP
jgi:hypothetical protein